jgi:V8-like Glu-specific endopeptidase
MTFLLAMTGLISTSSGAIFLINDQLERSVQFAADSRFQSVGAVRSSNFDGSSSPVGSGVLINSEWILTAGHVAWNRNTGLFRSGLSFNLGLDSNNPFLTVNASVHAVHPRFFENGGAFAYIGDLALLRLGAPITIVAPAVRYRGIDPPLGFPNPPQQYFMAGYGDYGVVIPGENGSSLNYPNDGKMRAGSNNGSRQGRPTDYDAIWTTFNSTNQSRDPNVDLEWNSSPGDSGGGMFMDVNGQFQLAGTITGGSNAFSFGQASSQMIRTTLFNDWIDQQITAVPEPSSLVLMGIASGLLIVAKRRSKLDKDTGCRAPSPHHQLVSSTLPPKFSSHETPPSH